MHVIVTVIIFVGLAAILIWVADWTSVSARRLRRLMFSIDALPAARSTGMTRSAS
jgi:hypothetical protein